LFEGGDAFFAAPLAGAAERIAAMAIALKMLSLGRNFRAKAPISSEFFANLAFRCNCSAF
jgi:hypothetical protein